MNIPGMEHLYDACSRHPIHAPFNFNLMSLSWGARSFRDFVDQYEASLGPDDWPNYVLGNHDRHRQVTRVGPERARLLAMLQLTLRGLPVVYYGDELGLPDGTPGPEQIRDPWEMRVPGYGLGRDGARTPMPWDDSAEAGFSSGVPWLPVSGKAHRLNILREDAQADSFLNLYRHLIHLRSASPALTVGDYRSIEVGCPYVYGYIRETELQRFLVILNFDRNPAEVMLHGRTGAWVAGTHEVFGDGLAPLSSTVTLKAYEGRVYELRKGDV